VILEIAATIAALVAGAFAVYMQAPKPAIAYFSAVVENLVFYGTAFLFELKRGTRWRGAVISTVAEFGPAEALDFLLLRPVCLYLGLNTLGTVGIVVGKVAADLVFYGIAFLTHKRIHAPMDAPRNNTDVAVNPNSSAN
jgi:hypothetical protein